MSEVKRAKLISFGAERANVKNSKEIRKTQRISVILPESTEDKCPEFNYKDELVAAKHKHLPRNPAPKPQQQQQTNGLDPFNEDDDDDVKRIAAEMEAKYGMGVAKKRKWRKDDYADIGMGYDESDSFIDNTDGYDEIIPKNVTTLHGGFYINCGALEFKTDEGMSTEESSSSEEDTPEKSVNRKRILESSAESEEETQTENQENVEQPKKKQKLVSSTPGGPTNTNGMQKAIKKRLFSHEKIKQQMRKKQQQRPDEQKKTVRELLKERRLDLNMTPALESESPEKSEPATSPKENKKPPLPPPPPLASVDDVIESVISGAVKKKDEPVDESSKDSTNSKDAVTNKSSALNSSEADSNDGLSIKPVEIVQLPENLPSDIIGIIDSIKKAAACSTEGKVKFFSGHVNTMLLNLERKCRCLGKQSRNKVYEHLAPFVKCRKETLIKRAKNLCVVEEQKKIKTLIDRLKSTVGIIMPPLIESYEEECRVVLQKKFSVTTEDAARNLRMPKRQFCWNEEMKKLLRDIITLRKKLYISEGKQKDSLEKHLTEFLKTEIQVIWPDGWMSMSSLLKLCNIVPDVKKSVDSTVKKSSSTSSPDLNITPTPSVTVNPSPIIPPISSNAALTITPVTTNVHKVNPNEKIKPKTVTISETIISKVNSDNCSSIAKPIMPLPPADIVKTSPPDLNNVKYTHSASTASNSNNPTLIKDDVDAIVIPESPIKKDDPEDLSTNVNTLNTVKPEIRHEIKDEIKTEPIPPKEKNSTNHCQVIDLTDQPELKKRPGPKSKTKFLYEYPDKGHKIKKDSDHVRKSKEEITGSSALTQIIADSLSDYNRFAQSAPKNANSTVINNTAATVNNPSDSAVKKLGSNSYEYTKAKSTSEGDDIQKVMEGLKVLQKMSSPVKSNDEAKTSSPVSVIAYNKSYSHDSISSSSTPHNSNIVTHRSNSFQDAFQKHFIPDFNLMKASQQAAASTSKGNYNSISKHNHTSTKSNSTSSDRYLQNSNNNYAQQNSSSKLKNSCSSQQSGSYDLLDDMFANFLSEYGQSKTANAKSSTQHK